MRTGRAFTSCLCLALIAPAAFAQGTGRSLDFDPSIRSAAMGGASGAVFWGGDANLWGNPALLAYHRGVRFEHGRTQLIPSLAEDVYFETDRTTIATSGIGFWHTGRPITASGGMRLSYGTSEGVDPNGVPTGAFEAFESIDGHGWAVSGGEVLATFAAMRGVEPPAFTRWADVAFGMSERSVLIALAPGQLGGVASGTGRDWGVLLRAGHDLGGADAPIPFRVEGGWGYSVLGFNDTRVTFINEDISAPLTRFHRSSFAVRAALGLPRGLREAQGPLPGWLLAGFDPLLSFGMARDFEHITAGSEGHGFDVDRIGAEIAVANVCWIRTGHVSDRLDSITGATHGIGWGFNLGRFGGCRWDRATVPVSFGLPKIDRKGWTAFVDPLAIVQALR